MQPSCKPLFIMKAHIKTYAYGAVFVFAGATLLWLSFRGADERSSPALQPIQAPSLPASASGIARPDRQSVTAKPVEPAAKSLRPEAFAPKRPYALSPGARSLGDTAQDVLARANAKAALSLVRALEECLKLDQRQAMIDLERAHPVALPGLTAARVKEQSEQLARSRSECQTVAGKPHEMALQLAELAYSSGEPGAALYLLRLGSDKATRASLLEALARDAQGGELHSLVATIVTNEVPLSRGQRIEMAFAVQAMFKDALFNKYEVTRGDLAGMAGGVAEHYWNGMVSRNPGAAPEPRSAVYKREASFVLPPDLTPPTDPAAQARIGKLTDQLKQQVAQMEKDREAARLRAGGS